MDTQLLPATFVELADTLVAGFDVIELMQHLVDRSMMVLAADAAGLMLANNGAGLEVLAADTDDTSGLERLQVKLGQGPCLECYTLGTPVAVSGPDMIKRRWPQVGMALEARGIQSCQALPMRLREQVIGAMNLFRKVPEPFTEEDIRVGQALADVATIGLLHERSMAEADTVNKQLQHALDSRVIIEQAKGKLSERLKLAPDEAFRLLRNYSRSHNFALTDVARFAVQGAPLPGLVDMPDIPQ